MSGVQFLKPASSPFSDDNEVDVKNLHEDGSITVDLDDDDDVEIVDDTPPEDQGKPTVPNQENVGDSEDLEQYGEKAQKRIQTLRFEYHNSERGRSEAMRERDAAIAHAKQLEQRLNQVAGQSHQTTTAFAKNMQKSHEEAIATAEALLAKAHADGESADIAKHTATLSRLNSELTQIKTQASQYDNAWKTQQAQEQAKQAQQQQPTPQQQQPQAIAPEAQKWLTANPWFTTHSTDPEMIVKQRDALDFNNALIQSGRYTANDPALYTAVDEYLNNKYPSKEDDRMGNSQTSTSGQPPVAGVNGAGKKTPGKKSRKMVLTQSEKRIADRLGVSYKAYALNKQKLEG
jgi:hypothetical protein